MILSKANQKKYAAWAFQPRPRKLADLPVYWGHLLTRSEGGSILFKVIVVKEPRYSRTSNYTMPVMFETGVHPSAAAAWKEAKEIST